MRSRACRTARAHELDRWVEANAAALRARGRRRLPARQPRPARRPGRGGERLAVRGQGARLGARVLDARQRGALALGRRGARRCAGDSRRVRAHPRRRAQRSAARSSDVHTVPPGVDIELWRPQQRVEAPRRAGRRVPQRTAEPGNRNERLPDAGNAERLASFLAGDRQTVVYYGKLIGTRASRCCSRPCTGSTPAP